MNISIIVPVFNVEKYLSRCLGSIFTQVFSGSFEVIAVDDCSTDRSLEILKEYQKSESRLKVVAHGVNKKLSVARRSGMDASTGDYIMHVDSDDWILPGTLELLFSKCISSDADVVVFDYFSEDSTGLQHKILNISEELFTEDKLAVQKYFFDTCVNKVVRRRLTENLIYGIIGINNVEDLVYSMEILLRANSIFLVNETLYVYFFNHASMTRTVNLETLLYNQIIIYRELQKILDANHYTPEFKRKLFAQREAIIYQLLLKNHLLHKKVRVPTGDLVNQLQSFYPHNDKLFSRLSKSAGSLYFNAVLYFLNIGILNSVSLALRKAMSFVKDHDLFDPPFFGV